jgi:glucosamine--fructose-6-phosphate aminotransferase (isomerizing)
MAEIAGQPGAIRRAAAGIRDHASELGRLATLGKERLLVFTGMGSSYDACYPAVNALGRVGRPAVMVDAAELLHFRSEMLRSDTLLVAVSQSGESAEIVALLDRVASRPERPSVVAVTNGTLNTLAAAAELTFDTRAGEETGPSTMTFAGALVVLSGIAGALAGRPAQDVAASLFSNAKRTAAAVEVILADMALPRRLASWLGGRSSVVILGRGPARAAAEMGALTIKEATGLMVESLETAQFRHGPLELAGPGLAAMLIATEPETMDIDLALARDLALGGAAVTVVGNTAAAMHGIETVAIGPLERSLAPAASVVPAQLLARELALARGRAPGSYVRASKVTTRE